MNAHIEALATKALAAFRSERGYCEVPIADGIMLKLCPRVYGAAQRFEPGVGWVDRGALTVHIAVANRRQTATIRPNWSDAMFIEHVGDVIAWGLEQRQEYVLYQMEGREWVEWSSKAESPELDMFRFDQCDMFPNHVIRPQAKGTRYRRGLRT